MDFSKEEMESRVGLEAWLLFIALMSTSENMREAELSHQQSQSPLLKVFSNLW